MLIAGAMLVAMDVAVGTQARPANARFNVGVEQYIESIYDEPPDAGVRYVFYQGETVRGSIRLLNADENADLVVTVPRGRPVDIVGLQAPGQLPTVHVEQALYVDTFGEKAAAEFDRQIHLPARRQIVLPFELVTAGLPGGVYRLRFRPQGWDSERPIRADYDVLSFELRERREPVQILEALYREITRAIWNLDLQSAETGVDRMLAVYPDSALAYSLRGQIARRLGRNSDAAIAERRAKELISEGRDRFHDRAQQIRRNTIR